MSQGAKAEGTLGTAGALARSVVWSQRKRLGLGLVLLVVDRAAGFVVPLAPKVLVDEVIGHGRVTLLPWLAVAVIAAAIVQAVAVFALTRVLGLSAERVVLRWRRRVMARVTALPVARFDETQVGTLSARVMDDAASVQSIVGWELARWTSNVLTSVVAFVALLWIDWKITLAALAFVAIPGLGLHFSHRKMRPLYRERSRARADVQGRLTQTLAGIRIVKAYGAERREELVFTRGLHRLFRLISEATTRKSAMNAVASVVSASVVAIVVVLGGRSILAGQMSLGDFGSYIAFALMFASPLLDLPEIATRVSETLADLDRVREIEAMTPELSGDESRAALGRVRGDVTFERVGFEYSAGVPVLEDVTFDVPAGTTVAIVGPSGAGKSTLLSLLLAFHRPTHGRILIDGRDLSTVRLRDYRKILGVVLQDEYLFDATIAENIGFGRPTATREEIAAASRLAHCDEFVRQLEDGLDTVVGERGVKLSGGQRQRVAIARAILADARVLVLDEATSSLDSLSETAIREAMVTLRKGRTSFVIAHRLSTVRSADLILVLDRGAIVERGTHEELLARPSRYRTLYEAQHAFSDEPIASE
ncbi:Lipid A export ATP-binding/permease protein MsbA [Labilithrix luteola]|uniref:Lipid A export ATP-binding/permease protein MsbA n=1 Tax=Labilithrix luteola TaxID=1391654 RepID=A0A0K1PQT9_9BACT|nr:ABC transporter ATP-binding protein [Labilithrix luteola]AKU95910.1 Lipid A export ATP-binding/permease protein MsbA [Labilithrix luteola]